MNLRKKLSPHFTLGEMLITNHRYLDNTPTIDDLIRLERFCLEFMEPVRNRFGPIWVSSGFRAKNLNQAIVLIGDGKKDKASVKINRTLEIIHYLSSILDYEKGGEIAVNLARLYDFVRDTLALANVKAEVKGIEEAIGVLRPLLEGWQAILDRAPAEAESNPSPPSEEGQNVEMVG